MGEIAALCSSSDSDSDAPSKRQRLHNITKLKDIQENENKSNGTSNVKVHEGEKAVDNEQEPTHKVYRLLRGQGYSTSSKYYLGKKMKIITKYWRIW